MPNHLVDPDIVAAIVAFLVAAAFAIHIVIIRQRAHEHRVAVLNLAHRALDDAFDAAETLVANSATPESIRGLVLDLCPFLAEQQAAHAYVRRDRKRKLGKLDGDGKLPESFHRELRALADGHPRLLAALSVFLTNFQTTTLLRWPETADLGLREMQPVQQCVSREKEIDRVEEQTQEVHYFTPHSNFGHFDHGKREMAAA